MTVRRIAFEDVLRVAGDAEAIRSWLREVLRIRVLTVVEGRITVRVVEVAEQMIERSVLEHEHDDVLDPIPGDCVRLTFTGHENSPNPW